MDKYIYKTTIIQAIEIIQKEIAPLKFSMSPEHAAKIALAWDNGYYVRWNPKYYVRPYLPNKSDSPITICSGNPKPNPGPFRIMCNDLELTHEHLTKNVNEKIKTLLDKMRNAGF